MTEHTHMTQADVNRREEQDVEEQAAAERRAQRAFARRAMEGDR